MNQRLATTLSVPSAFSLGVGLPDFEGFGDLMARRADLVKVNDPNNLPVLGSRFSKNGRLPLRKAFKALRCIRPDPARACCGLGEMRDKYFFRPILPLRNL